MYSISLAKSIPAKPRAKVHHSRQAYKSRDTTVFQSVSSLIDGLIKPPPSPPYIEIPGVPRVIGLIIHVPPYTLLNSKRILEVVCTRSARPLNINLLRLFMYFMNMHFFQDGLMNRGDLRVRAAGFKQF